MIAAGRFDVAAMRETVQWALDEQLAAGRAALDDGLTLQAAKHVGRASAFVEVLDMLHHLDEEDRCEAC